MMITAALPSSPAAGAPPPGARVGQGFCPALPTQYSVLSTSHAVAEDQLAVGGVDGDQRQLDPAGGREGRALDNRRARAADELRGEGEEQLVDETSRQETVIQVRAALAE